MPCLNLVNHQSYLEYAECSIYFIANSNLSPWLGIAFLLSLHLYLRTTIMIPLKEHNLYCGSNPQSIAIDRGFNVDKVAEVLYRISLLWWCWYFMLVIRNLCQILVGRTICQILTSRAVNYKKLADSQLAVDNACQIQWEDRLEAISWPLNFEGGYVFWACFLIGNLERQIWSSTASIPLLETFRPEISVHSLLE